MRHLISLFDLSQSELESIMSIASQLKEKLNRGERPALLERQVLGLLFEKPSLRTRASFAAGIAQLGGTAMFLGEEAGWRTREPTRDFIQVLAHYVDFVVCRSKSHQTVEELAAFDCVTVINGLTDFLHPCQALADLMTIREAAPADRATVVTFVGDGNNVACSLALACAMTGCQFRLLGPAAYQMPDEFVNQLYAKYPSAVVLQTEDKAAGLEGANFAYTDVWTSMGQEAESKQRLADFAEFQVNGDLLHLADPNCKVLHCLPARRGEEIDAATIEGPESLVIEQAGNRMHAQKGLLVWLALQNGLIPQSRLEQAGIRGFDE